MPRRFVVLLLSGLMLAVACEAQPDARAGGTAPARDTGGREGSDPAAAEKVVWQRWDWSCGAAALATLLTYQQGDPVSEREVMLGIFKWTTPARVQARGGFSLLDLKRYAEGRGYRAEGFGDLSLDDLAALGPAIVPVHLRAGDHFVVFRGRRGDELLLADPALGTRVMAVADFERIWIDRDAFVISPRHGRARPDSLAATPVDFLGSAGGMLRPTPP